jgi:peptidoglycan/xylan/chitin deacetylase (PgdA/CDA1 family)
MSRAKPITQMHDCDGDTDRVQAENRRQEAISRALAKHGAAVQRAMANPSERLEHELHMLNDELARAVREAEDNFRQQETAR